MVERSLLTPEVPVIDIFYLLSTEGIEKTKKEKRGRESPNFCFKNQSQLSQVHRRLPPAKVSLSQPEHEQHRQSHHLRRPRHPGIHISQPTKVLRSKGTQNYQFLLSHCRTGWTIVLIVVTVQ